MSSTFRQIMIPLAERPAGTLLTPLGWALLAGSTAEALRLLLPPEPGNFSWALATIASLLPCAAVWFLGYALIQEHLPDRREWWRLQLHRCLHWFCLATAIGTALLAPLALYNANLASTTLDSAFQSANSQGLVETGAIKKTLETAPGVPELRAVAEFLNLTEQFDIRLRENPNEKLPERANWLKSVLISSHNQFITNASDVLAQRRLELVRDNLTRSLAALALAAAGTVLWSRTRHLTGQHVAENQGDETAHD